MRILLAAATCLSVAISFAQGTGSGVSVREAGKGASITFVRDYYAAGVNPANLGWSPQNGKMWSIGGFDANGSMYSEALAKDDVRRNFKNIFNDDPDFPMDERFAAVEAMGLSGFASSFDMNMFSMAYQNEKVGGFALTVQQQFRWSSFFNQQMADLVFRGKFSNYFDSLLYDDGAGNRTMIANYNMTSPDSMNNVVSGHASVPLNISDLFDGSSLAASLNVEYGVSYGRKIFGDSTFAIYGGIGVKYIQSMGYFNLSATADGGLEFRSALSPQLGVEYGSVADLNPSNLVKKGKIPQTVGHGWGLDLGVSVLLFKKLKIGASVTDIGGVKYVGNVYRAKDTLLLSMNGGGMDQFSTVESVESLLDQDGLLELVGEEEYYAPLPATVRAGVSFEIHQMLEVGVEIQFPFNDAPGSIHDVAYGLGLDFRPAKWIWISAGYTGGGVFDHQIPLGLGFVVKEGTWECGIASQDAVTFFTKKTPTISAAMCFARFRF